MLFTDIFTAVLPGTAINPGSMSFTLPIGQNQIVVGITRDPGSFKMRCSLEWYSSDPAITGQQINDNKAFKVRKTLVDECHVEGEQGLAGWLSWVRTRITQVSTTRLKRAIHPELFLPFHAVALQSEELTALESLRGAFGLSVQEVAEEILKDFRLPWKQASNGISGAIPIQSSTDRQGGIAIKEIDASQAIWTGRMRIKVSPTIFARVRDFGIDETFTYQVHGDDPPDKATAFYVQKAVEILEEIRMAYDQAKPGVP